MHHAADAESDDFPGVIRKLWIGETGAFREHLLRLDPESRRNRFGSPVNEHFLARYAAHALGPESIVHGLFVDGTLRAAAELRPFGRPFSFAAEAALSVERDWQNRGVGGALLERTILAARNRGIRIIQMNCLASNLRMQAVAAKYGAELRFRADHVLGEVAAPAPTPLSWLRELIADQHGLATSILDAQTRLFRAA